jgi:hypothetical protein
MVLVPPGKKNVCSMETIWERIYAPGLKKLHDISLQYDQTLK